MEQHELSTILEALRLYQRDNLSERHRAIIERAQDQYEGSGGHSDGDINVDDDALVSENDEPSENGCYVAAWVWVRFEGTPFDKTSPSHE